MRIDNSLLFKLHEEIDDLYKWQTFRHTGLHQNHISHSDHHYPRVEDHLPHVKSGSDEVLCAETPAIYINHQNLRDFTQKRMIL